MPEASADRTTTPHIVDAHVHLWPALAGADKPIVAGISLPDFDGTPETLLNEMDKAQVAAAVVVQTPWFALDDTFLHDCVRRFPERLVAIACELDAASDEACLRLRTAVGYGMRGVRTHIVGKAQIAAFKGGGMDAFIAEAQALSVPVCLLYRNQDVHALVAECAARFPRAIFVVDHLGHADPRDEAATAMFLELHRLDNVFVKVSLHHRLSASDFPWKDLWDFQRALVRLFGAGRLMWGSNFPMYHPLPDYRQRLEAVTGLDFLSAADKREILGGTATKLWFEEKDP